MIKDRLYNWSSWAKQSSRLPISCKSLESRYRAPPMYEPPPKVMVIDILDAIEVERSIVSMCKRDREIIVYAYIHSWRNFDRFCSRHRIFGNKDITKSEQFELEQTRAENILSRKLLGSGVIGKL